MLISRSEKNVGFSHENQQLLQTGEYIVDAHGGARPIGPGNVTGIFSRSVSRSETADGDPKSSNSSLSIIIPEAKVEQEESFKPLEAPQELSASSSSVPFNACQSVQEASQVIKSKNPMSMTVQQFVQATSPWGDVGYFTNCDRIEEVETFFLSDIHDHPVPRQMNTSTIACLHQPADRVYLEDIGSSQTGMIDCTQLPEDIEYRCWDNKRLPRDWTKPTDQLNVLYKKIEELAQSGASKSQWLSFYTNEVLPVIREHKNLIDGFKDDEIFQEFENAKRELCDAIDFGIDYHEIIKRCSYLGCLSLSNAIKKEICIYAQDSYQSRQEGLVSSLVHEEGRSFVIAGQLHFLSLHTDEIETNLREYLEGSLDILPSLKGKDS